MWHKQFVKVSYVLFLNSLFTVFLWLFTVWQQW